MQKKRGQQKNTRHILPPQATEDHNVSFPPEPDLWNSRSRLAIPISRSSPYIFRREPPEIQKLRPSPFWSQQLLIDPLSEETQKPQQPAFPPNRGRCPQPAPPAAE